MHHKGMNHGRNLNLNHLWDVLWNLVEKQPHLQDFGVTANAALQHKTPPASPREGLLPNFIPVRLVVSAKFNEPPESMPR